MSEVVEKDQYDFVDDENNFTFICQIHNLLVFMWKSIIFYN